MIVRYTLPRGRSADRAATTSACSANSTMAATMLAATLLHASAHAEREQFERRERAERHDVPLGRQSQRPVAALDPAAAHEIREAPRQDAVDVAVAFVGPDQPLAMAERPVV